VGVYAHEQFDFGSSAQGVATRVLGNGECTGSIGPPDMLILFVIWLGGDNDLVGHEEDRLKSDAKLADQVILIARLRFLNLFGEIGSAWLGDSA